VKNVQAKVEKATLGDLGVLADLKKKMDSGETTASEEPKSE
jgi:small subunit ribosomal protein S1